MRPPRAPDQPRASSSAAPRPSPAARPIRQASLTNPPTATSPCNGHGPSNGHGPCNGHRPFRRPRPGRTASHAVLAGPIRRDRSAGGRVDLSSGQQKALSSSWSSWCWPRSATGSSAQDHHSHGAGPGGHLARLVGASQQPDSGIPGAQGPRPHGDGLPAATGPRERLRLAPVHPAGPGRRRSSDGKFGADYNTFSFAEALPGYVGTMNGLITGRLASHAAGPSTPPGDDQGQDQPETGVHRDHGDRLAALLRPLQPDIHRHRGAAPGHLARHHRSSTQYAITVTGSGTSWQVNDIELSTAGQLMTNRL